MENAGRRVPDAVALLGLVVGLLLPASGQEPAERRLALDSLNRRDLYS